MSLTSIINRLQASYPDFSYSGSSSILSSLISLISYEIDSTFGRINNTNQQDLFLLTGTSLDDIASILGITRQVITLLDQNAVVPDAVYVVVKDISKSILTVLQELYGAQSNFPKSFYISDGNNTLEVILNFDTSDKLDAHLLTLPVRFVSFTSMSVPSGTNFTITGDHQQLSEYLSIISAVQLSLYQYVESSESLRLRVLTALQNYKGPSTSWIESYITGNFTNVRYVLTKNFLRGLLTADIILFPTLLAIYDENQQLIINNTLAETVETEISKLLPLGIDVLFKNASQIPLDIIVWYSDVPDDNLENFYTDLKNAMINTLYNYPVGTQQTLTVEQIKSDFNKLLAVVTYPYSINSIDVKINNESVVSINIAEDQYIVLNTLLVLPQ